MHVSYSPQLTQLSHQIGFKLCPMTGVYLLRETQVTEHSLISYACHYWSWPIWNGNSSLPSSEVVCQYQDATVTFRDEGRGFHWVDCHYLPRFSRIYLKLSTHWTDSSTLWLSAYITALNSLTYLCRHPLPVREHLFAAKCSAVARVGHIVCLLNDGC